VIISAHGIELELPSRWSGRAFRRPAGNATLHAGDFALALQDGEFGDRSTAQMPAGAAFLALVEYLPGDGLQPDRGLFESRRIPLPLDPSGFASRRLAHPRPGQSGMQHFFTSGGRPFCLYVVLVGGGPGRRRQLAVVSRVLRSLRIEPAGGGAGAGASSEPR
jgi:hypothetical protein